MRDRLAFAPSCALVILLVTGGCHRTGLGLSGAGDAGTAPGEVGAAARDVALVVPDATAEVRPAGADLSPDLALVVDLAVAVDRAAPPPDVWVAPPAVTPGCQPRPEECNGSDDDCDGKIDQGLTPIPCPNGGSRFCVSGRLSDCPRVCEVCRPGSTRVCLISYCTYWGRQTCAPDGRSFGPCRESPVPRECEAIARTHRKSPELGRCCIDNGYCCVDDQDVDGDRDRTEMLGRCGAVTCPP